MPILKLKGFMWNDLSDVNVSALNLCLVSKYIEFTHCILNILSHTISWKNSISILGTSGYEIYILLEKNG